MSNTTSKQLSVFGDRVEIVKALPIATYSLQFWFDKEMRPNLTETANDGELPDNLNMISFGIDTAHSKLLSKEDKKRFAKFCETYLAHYNDIESKE